MRKRNKASIGLILVTFLMIGIVVGQSAIFTASSDIIPEISLFGPSQCDPTPDIADVYEEITFVVNLSFPSGQVNYFIYNFHDGTEPQTSYDGIISHGFQYEGNYLVTVTAVGMGGITDEATTTVYIRNDVPSANLMMPSSANEDQIVFLSAINVQDPNDLDVLRYQWLFGDGQFYEGAVINHSWSTAGNYPVTLTILDDQNAIFTKTECIDIINTAPEAHFTASKVEACEDEVILFNASDSIDTFTDSYLLRYYWDFGDGAVGRDKSINHVYTQSGTYEVKLTVIDDNGLKDEEVMSILINNLPPSIDALDEHITLYEGESHVFETTSSDTISDYQVLDYSWSFGESGWRASNAWNDDLEGEASVTVTDPEGLTASDIVGVTILNLPPSVSVFEACIEAEVTLEAWGTPGNAIYLFIIEDGILINGASILSDWCSNESEPISLSLDLSKDYQIIVNVTESEDTPYHWINRAKLNFEFSDGSTWTSCEYFLSNYGCHQSDDPKQWIIDPEEYLFRWPISFKGLASDPGSDALNITADFDIHITLDINTIFWCLFPEYYYSTCSIDDNTTLIVELWRDGSDITVQIDVSRDVLDIHHDDPASWPAQVDFTALVKPFDLSFLQILDWCIFSNPLLDIDVVEAQNILNVEVSDDDGGSDQVSIIMNTGDGELDIENLAPRIELEWGQVLEDQIISFTASIDDPDGDSVEVTWNMGDGTVLTGAQVSHSYSTPGDYLIQVEATDGDLTTTKTKVLTVVNNAPDVDILGIFTMREDYRNEYEIFVQDSSIDMDELRYMWYFDDGLTAFGTETIHSWARSGMYNLHVKVMDDNGAIGEAIECVSINDFAPVIEGNLGYNAPEGTVIILDLYASDSVLDEVNLEYDWQINGYTTTGIKPSIWKDDGEYSAHLTVTDQDGFQSNEEIDIIFINTPPYVYYSHYVIYGDEDLSFALKAHGIDSHVDIADLSYDWVLNGFSETDNAGGTFSTVNWPAVTTSQYLGQVIVSDDSETSYNGQFQVVVTMDQDGDGLTDEEEFILDTSPSDSDMDGDWITDWYEVNVYHTNPSDPDTDGDGLYDGFGEILDDQGNPIFVGGVQAMGGELTAGTDPNNPDTDDDGLLDGIEVAGWEITVDKMLQDESGNFVTVTEIAQPNPLVGDSDGEGLSDWVEYTCWFDLRAIDPENRIPDERIGFNPMLEDTNGNGLTDWEELEVYYLVGDHVDSDGDGLLDSQELGDIIDYIYVETLNLYDGSWENTQELDGDLVDTFEEDETLWEGRREDVYTKKDYYFENLGTETYKFTLWDPSTPTQPPTRVITYGEIQNIDPQLISETTELHLKLEMTAQYMKGELQMWDFLINDWVTVINEIDDGDQEITLTITEAMPNQFIHQIEGDNYGLKYKLLAGVSEIVGDEFETDEFLGSEFYLVKNTPYIYTSEIKLDHVFWTADGAIPVFENHSDVNNADTDGDGLNDWEEWYPGVDGFITELRNNDTDGDELLDSAESYSSMKELGERKKIDKNTLTSFSFYTDMGSSAINATTTIAISVGEDNGLNPADLIVRLKFNDVLLFENESFDRRYYCNITDVKDLVDEWVGTYEGTWLLEVESTEKCMIEEFKVEITKRLNPLDPDFDSDGILDGHELNPEFDGWITNPASSDTDADGWSDLYEIESTGTNPNSVDTDGDSVPDPQDHDPLRNLVVQVTIHEAHIDDTPFKPQMCITIIINGQAVVVTPYVWASLVQSVRYWWWDWLHVYPYYIPTTGVFGYTYTFDVPDQDQYVSIAATLWFMQAYPNIGDPWLGHTYYYDVTGDPDPVPISNYNGKRTMDYTVETKGLEHVNTIAVHEEGNFNGNHYPTIEKMNVIVLDVTEADEVFTQGFNVIVIPTSLFVNSQLHALIEQSVDDLGAFVQDSIPTCLLGAEFYGLDRNNEEYVSQYVESTITKSGVSLTEAWEILMLCLISADDTEGEIYTFVSTKADLVNATELGLAPDVLSLIPIDGTLFEQDDHLNQGTMPQTWLSAWVQWWGYVGYLLFSVMVAIGNFFATLWVFVINLGMAAAGAIGEAAMAAIEVIVKALILIFIYIILALHIFFTTINYLLMGVMMLLIAPLLGGTATFGLWFLEFTKEGMVFRQEDSIGWKYNNFLDLIIPITIQTNTLNGQIVKRTERGFLDTELVEEDGPIDLTGSSSGNSAPLIQTSSNSNAILENPYVYPLTGLEIDEFTFEVTYRDPDSSGGTDRAPQSVQLVLIYEGNEFAPRDMTLIDSSPNYQTGARYSITIPNENYPPLPTSGQQYIVIFRAVDYDGEDVQQLQTTGPYVFESADVFSLWAAILGIAGGLVPMLLFGIAGPRPPGDPNVPILAAAGITVALGALLTSILVNIIGGEIVDPGSSYIGSLAIGIICLIIAFSLYKTVYKPFDFWDIQQFGGQIILTLMGAILGIIGIATSPSIISSIIFNIVTWGNILLFVSAAMASQIYGSRWTIGLQKLKTPHHTLEPYLAAYFTIYFIVGMILTTLAVAQLVNNP